MKLALIPPLSLLETADTNYYMVLPQLCSNKRYYQFIKKKCEDPNNFVILDNGAAEDVEFDWPDLVNLAIELGVDEVVIPDTINNPIKTLEQSYSFLKTYKSLLQAYGIKTAFVVHVRVDDSYRLDNMWQEAMSVIKIVNMHFSIDTIALPRILLRNFGHSDVRIDLAYHATKPVHFLGMFGDYPYEFDIAPNKLKHIRGVDTSAPYNFTYSGYKMAESHLYADRPEEYFELSQEGFDEYLLNANIDYLKGQVDGV
jgi:hypothetical protein